jgi:PBP1b-binding outer membrane lipoprotein LpoB
MKKQILGILIATVLIFSGCSSKGSASTASDANKNNTNNQTEASVSSADTTKLPTASPTSSAGVNTDFEPIKAGTVPPLSVEQKKQIDTKLSSAVKNIDNALKSLQDPSDINLDSVK